MGITSSRVLQRKCACGKSGGDCTDCRAKRELQRQATGTGPAVAPPIVHEVLSSPGQPLDAPTRAFMEPRFGHDFSNVRVHVDEQAAESAAAVNARAYTVGQHVAFGSGEFKSGTSSGRRLLTHELTYVVQQETGGSTDGPPLRISEAQNPAEQEAEQISSMVGEYRPHVHAAPATLHRDPKYPDVSCDSVKDNITAAWPSAQAWVRNARIPDCLTQQQSQSPSNGIFGSIRPMPRMPQSWRSSDKCSMSCRRY